MIRDRQSSQPVIDLTGPDGNAFMLLARAQKYARDLSLNGPKIMEEMKAGDYEHLITVFDRHFGEYVVLER